MVGDVSLAKTKNHTFVDQIAWLLADSNLKEELPDTDPVA
jgi:hypothetical protein